MLNSIVGSTKLEYRYVQVCIIAKGWKHSWLILESIQKT